MAVPPPVKARLFWLREAVTPAGADRPRETAPEKLLRLVRVIVEMPEEELTRMV